MAETKPLGKSWKLHFLFLYLISNWQSTIQGANITTTNSTLNRPSTNPTTSVLTASNSTTVAYASNQTLSPTKIANETTAAPRTTALPSTEPPSSTFKCPKGCECSKCVNPQQGFALVCQLQKSSQLGGITGKRNKLICSL